MLALSYWILNCQFELWLGNIMSLDGDDNNVDLVNGVDCLGED